MVSSQRAEPKTTEFPTLDAPGQRPERLLHSFIRGPCHGQAQSLGKTLPHPQPAQGHPRQVPARRAVSRGVAHGRRAQRGAGRVNTSSQGRELGRVRGRRAEDRLRSGRRLRRRRQDVPVSPRPRRVRRAAGELPAPARQSGKSLRESPRRESPARALGREILRPDGTLGLPAELPHSHERGARAAAVVRVLRPARPRLHGRHHEGARRAVFDPEIRRRDRLLLLEPAPGGR